MPDASSTLHHASVDQGSYDHKVQDAARRTHRASKKPDLALEGFHGERAS